MVQRPMEILSNADTVWATTVHGPLRWQSYCTQTKGGVTRSQTRTAAIRDTAIKECLPWDFLAVISLIILHTF